MGAKESSAHIMNPAKNQLTFTHKLIKIANSYGFFLASECVRDTTMPKKENLRHLQENISQGYKVCMLKTKEY